MTSLEFLFDTILYYIDITVFCSRQICCFLIFRMPCIFIISLTTEHSTTRKHILQELNFLEESTEIKKVGYPIHVT